MLAEPSAAAELYPFSILHCAWEVRCGALRLFEKYGRYFPEASLHFAGRRGHIRSFIARNYPQTGENPPAAAPMLLILAGNILPDAGFARALWKIAGELREGNAGGFLLENSGNAIGAALHGKTAQRFTSEYSAVAEDDFFAEDAVALAAKFATARREIPAKRIRYLWDALALNGEAIAADAALAGNVAPFRSGHAGAVVGVNEAAILAADSAEIAPGVVLDATDGPILLGENVRVMANSVIMGPCAVGAGSVVKIGAKIYGQTSFGESCKIGGEVENSIVQGFSSKQHDGYLGNSYLGEWVNLGADTNTSNLKNTYGQIIARLDGNRIPTGRIMLGLLCGDHTKSGINTMFAAGTAAGVSSSVMGAGYAPQVIPSFSFGGQTNSPRYRIEQALDVARIVMARRGKTLLPDEEALLRAEYNVAAR